MQSCLKINMPPLTILSDEQISELTHEPKITPSGLFPLGKMTERFKHKRKEIKVNSASDSGNEFVIMVRQSTVDSLNFSAILAYKMPGFNTLFRLRRYNGKHVHTNSIEREQVSDFHVHIATERYQKQGLREDGFAIPTSRHHDLHSAIECLVEDCGFTTGPPEAQIPLPLSGAQ